MGCFAKGEVSRGAVTGMVAGGGELRELEVALAEIARGAAAVAS
jgi:hypothetical protein